LTLTLNTFLSSSLPTHLSFLGFGCCCCGGVWVRESKRPLPFPFLFKNIDWKIAPMYIACYPLAAFSLYFSLFSPSRACFSSAAVLLLLLLLLMKRRTKINGRRIF